MYYEILGLISSYEYLHSNLWLRSDSRKNTKSKAQKLHHRFNKGLKKSKVKKKAENESNAMWNRF